MIVRRNPEKELDKADQAWFESDANDNVSAIREIDAEASKHGLVRTREYWLQTFSYEGRVVRRGFCYRPAPSERIERGFAPHEGELVGVSSADLVRSMRDEE